MYVVVRVGYSNDARCAKMYSMQSSCIKPAFFLVAFELFFSALSITQWALGMFPRVLIRHVDGLERVSADRSVVKGAREGVGS